MMPRKLIIATNNAGKAEEIKAMLAELGEFEFFLPKDFGLAEPEETGLTYLENARIKAQYYGQASGMPALADDSGLEIAALDNFPGVISARFAKECGGFEASFDELEQRLASISNLSARFTCALSLYWPESGFHDFIGICEGHLTFPAKGPNGFGFDPIFTPKGYTQSFAELGEAVKSQISHRKKAFDLLKDWISQ